MQYTIRVEKLSEILIIIAYSVLSFSFSVDNSNKTQSECILEVPDREKKK